MQGRGAGQTPLKRVVNVRNDVKNITILVLHDSMKLLIELTLNLSSGWNNIRKLAQGQSIRRSFGMGKMWYQVWDGGREVKMNKKRSRSKHRKHQANLCK